MKKRKPTKTATPIENLLPKITLSLKIFDLTLVPFKDTKLLGHIQSVYKKKKYLFYVKDHLFEKNIEEYRFVETIKHTRKNEINFVVICRTHDLSLEKYITSNQFNFKLIPLNRLSELAQQYMTVKESQ